MTPFRHCDLADPPTVQWRVVQSVQDVPMTNKGIVLMFVFCSLAGIVSAATFNVRDFGAKGDGVTDDKAAFNAAFAAVKAAGGGEVYVPTGQYFYDSLTGYTGNETFTNEASNVTVLGDGSNVSVIHFTGPGLTLGTARMDINRYCTAPPSGGCTPPNHTLPSYYLMNNVSAGSVVTLMNPAQAANFTAGEVVFLESGDASPGTGHPPTHFEFNTVASANSTTGVIALQNPLSDAYDSSNPTFPPMIAPISVVPTTITIQNLGFTTTAPDGMNQFISFNGTMYATIDHCSFTRVGGAALQYIWNGYSWHATISNSNFSGVASDFGDAGAYFAFRNNVVGNISHALTGSGSGRQWLFDGNQMSGLAFSIGGSPTSSMAGLQISNNTFQLSSTDPFATGAAVFDTTGAILQSNTCLGVTTAGNSGACVTLGDGTVNSNVFQNVVNSQNLRTGVSAQSGASGSMIHDNQFDGTVVGIDVLSGAVNTNLGCNTFVGDSTNISDKGANTTTQCSPIILSSTSVLLDDFSTMRTNGIQPAICDATHNTADTSNCLWPGMDNQGPTWCQTSNGTLVCTTQGLASDGLGVWLATLDCNATGCYGDAGSWMKSYVKSGSWDANVNRLRFSYKCSADIAALPGGGHWLEIGTYVRGPEPTAAESGQGQHYYQFLNPGSAANEWVNVELNRMVQHQVGANGNTIYPEDPEFQAPTLGEAPIHYFDGMTHFYFGPTYAPEMRASGLTCTFGPMTLDKVANGADAYVSGITGTYNPGTGQYGLSWNQPKHIPGGVTFDVRYSPNSMRVNGWSQGTSGGSATGADNSPYTEVNYTSPGMTRASTLYFAIRPRMPVASVAVNGAIRLVTHAEHFLSTGDSVNVSNICAAANGAHTITVIDTTTLSLDGTSGPCSYAAGGTVTATDDKKNFAEFLIGAASTSTISTPPGSNPPTTTVAPLTLNVRVYPNPWRSDKHAGHPSMIFDGLTTGTTIKLFTTSGHKVKELHTDGPSIPWDLTNDSGDKIASGIYIYLVTDSRGGQGPGKSGGDKMTTHWERNGGCSPYPQETNRREKYSRQLRGLSSIYFRIRSRAGRPPAAPTTPVN